MIVVTVVRTQIDVKTLNAVEVIYPVTSKLCCFRERVSHLSPQSTMAANVYFDVETTGFGNFAQIVQIGADCDGRTFSKYVLPECAITADATNVHKIAKSGSNLIKDGRILNDVVGAKKAIEDFFRYLSSVARNGEVCLIAHNGKRIDFKVLENNVRKFGADIPNRLTIKMYDSMALARERGYRKQDCLNTVSRLTYALYYALYV